MTSQKTEIQRDEGRFLSKIKCSRRKYQRQTDERWAGTQLLAGTHINCVCFQDGVSGVTEARGHCCSEGYKTHDRLWGKQQRNQVFMQKVVKKNKRKTWWCETCNRIICKQTLYRKQFDKVFLSSRTNILYAIMCSRRGESFRDRSFHSEVTTLSPVNNKQVFLQHSTTFTDFCRCYLNLLEIYSQKSMKLMKYCPGTISYWVYIKNCGLSHSVPCFTPVVLKVFEPTRIISWCTRPHPASCNRKQLFTCRNIHLSSCEIYSVQEIKKWYEDQPSREAVLPRWHNNDAVFNSLCKRRKILKLTLCKTCHTYLWQLLLNKTSKIHPT